MQKKEKIYKEFRVLVCHVCKAQWQPVKESPIKCARCQSKNWEKGNKK